MVVITVVYPASEGATFDYDYYVQTHLPLVRRLWEGRGLVKVTALRGVSAAGGGEPPYLAFCLIEFESMDALVAAMANAEDGKVLADDLPNFSNVPPVIQVNYPMA